MTAFVEPVISCTPGALIATIVADAATASGARGVHIELASDISSITAAVADTATSSGTRAVEIYPTIYVFFICGAAMADAVTSSNVGADAIAQDRTACTAVSVADISTASGTSIVDIVGPGTSMPIADAATASGATASKMDPASEIFFVICGAAVAATVTTNAAGADAVAHDRTACIATIIADIANALGASAVDINLASETISIAAGASMARVATISLIGIDTTSGTSVVDIVGPGTPMPTDCIADVATSSGHTGTYHTTGRRLTPC